MWLFAVPDARKWSGHPWLFFFFFAFCVGFQKQLAVFLSCCVKDWWFPFIILKNEHPLNFCWHTVGKVKIISSIKSRLLSLHVCVTAWCGCELYCMYICAFIGVCIYICTCNIHTVIYSHAYVNAANPILFWY